MNAPAKVDVRRILDSIIVDYGWQADRADPEMKTWILAKKAEAEKARAAVAELIEAAAVVHDQVGGPDHDGSCSQAAFDRLRAALARVGGAA